MLQLACEAKLIVTFPYILPLGGEYEEEITCVSRRGKECHFQNI